MKHVGTNRRRGERDKARDNESRVLTRIAELRRRKVEEFPPSEVEVRPTIFGNRVAAFESYPSVMYGLEPTKGWNRLLGVIPNEYRALIDDARTYTDFWVNLWLFGIVFLIEYVAFAVYVVGVFGTIWLPLFPWVPLIASGRYSKYRFSFRQCFSNMCQLAQASAVASANITAQ